jgi:hypothetical protein
VYQFATQIIKWVGEMKAAFENGETRRGGFSWKTRMMLEKRWCVLETLPSCIGWIDWLLALSSNKSVNGRLKDWQVALYL